MIQRYDFDLNNLRDMPRMETDPDGAYVLYADHVAALTVTDAMVERAWKAYCAKSDALTQGRWLEIAADPEAAALNLDNIGIEEMRAALLAALTPAPDGGVG